MHRFVKLLMMLALIVMAGHGLGGIAPPAAAMPSMTGMQPDCPGHIPGTMGDHCGAMDLCCCALAPAGIMRIDRPIAVRPRYAVMPGHVQIGFAVPPALPPPRA